MDKCVVIVHFDVKCSQIFFLFVSLRKTNHQEYEFVNEDSISVWIQTCVFVPESTAEKIKK